MNPAFVCASVFADIRLKVGCGGTDNAFAVHTVRTQLKAGNVETENAGQRERNGNRSV